MWIWVFISLVYISRSRVTGSNGYSIYSLKEQADYFPKWLNNFIWSFPGGSGSKDSSCNAGDPGLIPGSGRSPGGGHGHLLQYSCLENLRDRGAWRLQSIWWRRVRHDWSDWAHTPLVVKFYAFLVSSTKKSFIRYTDLKTYSPSL